MTLPTLLVVEDHPINLKTLVHLLGKDRFNILTATSGKETFIQISKKIPDLILLDIELPDTTGYDIIENLKLNPATAAIPVIFATGKNDTQSKSQAFSRGGVDYVTKPYEKMEILARIQVHLKLHATIRQLENSQAETIQQLQSAQQSLLPQSDDFPLAHFRVLYQSLNASGGDFYEIIPYDEYRTAYFVGDLSGHDVKTSFLTASIKALLKQNCTDTYEPLESLRIVNNILVKLFKPGQYLTASFFMIDRKKSTLFYINMGHLPLIHWPAGKTPYTLEGNGNILGAFTNIDLEGTEISLTPEDLLICITDGLIEESQNQIWTAALPVFLKELPRLEGMGFSILPEKIYQLFYSQHKKPNDDVLILTVKIRPPENLVVNSGPQSLELIFSSTTEHIDQIIENVSQFVLKHDPHFEIFGLKLILYEALNNGRTHGNLNQENLYLKLKVSMAQEQLKLEIHDEGAGFDWKKHLSLSMPTQSESHGRGFPLMEAYGYKASYNKWGNQIFLTHTKVKN